jgi:hypothetical protein
MSIDEFNPATLQKEALGVRFLSFRYSEIVVVTRREF